MSDVHHDPDVSQEVHVRAPPRAARVPDQGSGLAAAAAAQLRHGSRRNRQPPRSGIPPRSAATGSRAALSSTAKQYSGITIGRINEAGPQALDDKNFSGPLWEKLTGIKMTVTEAPFAQIRTKILAEHVARSDARLDRDVARVAPDFADQGVILPIDSLIRKHRAQSTLSDLHPLYRALGRYKGKTWGFFDDGDVWALYYRKDIFGNAKLKAAYRAKFRRTSACRAAGTSSTRSPSSSPTRWHRRPMAPGWDARSATPASQFYFFQQFRANGGRRFFNPRTMRAEINNAIGVKTTNQILLQNKASPPGVEKLDFVSGWGLWLQGKTAMIMAWPPTGRISENYSQRDEAFSFLPKSAIVDQVGYQRVPGLNGEHAGSFIKAVMATSDQQEAAYLFNQWANSPSISLQRVMLPYTLRDPYRISHYKSARYKRLWPSAASTCGPCRMRQTTRCSTSR